MPAEPRTTIVLSVGTAPDGGQFLSVRDNGPGIPADEIPKVLQAFGQGTLAQQTAEGGAGLGLAIVQNLIELHGGSLDLQSELRKGTDAKVVLPAFRVLRAMLRQAPNIILVGEIRDLEVADIAIQAALTGHLVFSTLHTNDAPGAITRLIDMGVKPFLVASSIQAIMAQRPIRVLCPKCKQPDKEPDPMWLKLTGITARDMEGKTIYKPKGCDYCTGTGFRGRVGIFELMQLNNEIRALAFDRAPTNKIRKAALASGMKSLLMDGRLKVLNGVTTAEEIVKVAQVEGVIVDE